MLKIAFPVGVGGPLAVDEAYHKDFIIMKAVLKHLIQHCFLD